MILRLTRNAFGNLENEARKRSPIEACAILFGKLSKTQAVVKRVALTTNVLQSTTRFEIDTKEFYDAFTKAEKDGLVFLGFFHSHPAQAGPSSVDLHFMQLWADAIWLIFSLSENRSAAFQMRNGKACALDLIVEGKN